MYMYCMCGLRAEAFMPAHSHGPSGWRGRRIRWRVGRRIGRRVGRRVGRLQRLGQWWAGWLRQPFDVGNGRVAFKCAVAWSGGRWTTFCGRFAKRPRWRYRWHKAIPVESGVDDAAAGVLAFCWTLELTSHVSGA
jgi:hypothetical protein